MTTTKPHVPGQIEGGISYITEEGGPAIRVRGRMDRQAADANQVSLTLPRELRERIEALQDGGGINGAMVGLIHFALDELERRQQTLRVDLGGGA